MSTGRKRVDTAPIRTITSDSTQAKTGRSMKIRDSMGSPPSVFRVQCQWGLQDEPRRLRLVPDWNRHRFELGSNDETRVDALQSSHNDAIARADPVLDFL